MARYSETTSVLGSRIMEYRKARKLTQADLADRYKVSGPAIFKFEKGFVTPSLKLWQTVAEDIGIPEKEAVLIWVREKLPNHMKDLITNMPVLDVKTLATEIEGLGEQPQALKKMREILLKNTDMSPALKKFIANNDMWNTLKPTANELLFLIDLGLKAELHSVSQYRDAMIIARSIQNPEA